MDYLRKQGCIVTAKKPRGVLITLVNYDLYQTLSNYERTEVETNKKSDQKPVTNQQRPPINKNVKKLKNATDSLAVEMEKHLIKCGIQDPWAYLRRLIQQTSEEAVKRGWKDWKRGNGINSMGQFWQRCEHYHSKE